MTRTPMISTWYDAATDEWCLYVNDGRSPAREVRRPYFSGMLLALGDEWATLQPEPVAEAYA